MPSDFDKFAAAARLERGGFFDPDRSIVAARAPGWVDLLGGSAAYGGSLALGWPLASTSFVAVQADPAPTIRLRDETDAEVALALADLEDASGWPREYAAVAAGLVGRPAVERLVAGAWLMLLREEFVRFGGGARLLLRPASGPGAAASLVAALTQALVSAFAVHIAPRELALGCRTALVRLGDGAAEALGPFIAVSAPAGELLLLHQQPAWHWGNLHLPHGAAIWALRVGAGPAPGHGYTGAAAAMAYRMVADAAELTPREADAHWGGYLANLGTARFERRYRPLLPVQLTGADFLARYPTFGAAIASGAAYPLRAAAALPVEEHLRARTTIALLRAAASKAQREDDLLLVGELMARSHWDQRAAGLGDAHADALVDLIYAAGPQEGLYGARSPAPASGATLVVLGRSEGEPALRAICQHYAAECGLAVEIFGGSSPGCNPAGTKNV